MDSIDRFIDHCRLTDHVLRNPERGPYPEELEKDFPQKLFTDAQNAISTWEGYSPTSLHSLSPLAERLEIADLLFKDESTRFGLGSFKALGGAYAVQKLLDGKSAGEITVATATDGNHGRSVAWGARRAGCDCVIYIHREVSEGREKAMADLGARVVRVDGDYDESVRQCAEDAAANDWEIISDTSWEGYENTPKLVMAGYTMMVREILDECSQPPTHVIIQAGVGGLAGAITAALWQALGQKLPYISIVESEYSACLMASARAGNASSVEISSETMMAGLSCGETSRIAWRILERSANLFTSIPDNAVAEGMRLLASGEAGPEIEAGECALPGVIAISAIAANPDYRKLAQIDKNSRVLVFGCEGATDPEIYNKILAGEV